MMVNRKNKTIGMIPPINFPKTRKSAKQELKGHTRQLIHQYSKSGLYNHILSQKQKDMSGYFKSSFFRNITDDGKDFYMLTAFFGHSKDNALATENDIDVIVEKKFVLDTEKLRESPEKSISNQRVQSVVGRELTFDNLLRSKYNAYRNKFNKQRNKDLSISLNDKPSDINKKLPKTDKNISNRKIVFNKHNKSFFDAYGDDEEKKPSYPSGFEQINFYNDGKKRLQKTTAETQTSSQNKLEVKETRSRGNGSISVIKSVRYISNPKMNRTIGLLRVNKF